MNALRGNYSRLLEILGAGKLSLLFTSCSGRNPGSAVERSLCGCYSLEMFFDGDAEGSATALKSIK
jgi:hypothetical protein